MLLDNLIVAIPGYCSSSSSASSSATANSSAASSSSTSTTASSVPGSSGSGVGSGGNPAAGRHNSSGSTGSEGTNQTGSSPASLHNYSPPNAAAGVAPNPAGPGASNYMVTPNGSAHRGINSGAPAVNSSLGSYTGSLPTAANEYGVSAGGFDFSDPRMSNPPNASALDVPSGSAAAEQANPALPYLPGRASHHLGHLPVKPPESAATHQDFFGAGDMGDTDLLGNSRSRSPQVTSNGYSSSSTTFPSPSVASHMSGLHVSQSDSLHKHHQASRGLVPPGVYPGVPHPGAGSMVQIPVGPPGIGGVPDHHLQAPNTDGDGMQVAIKPEGSKMTLGLGSALRALSGQEEMFEDYPY